MTKTIFHVFAALFLLVVACTNGWAQATAQISGVARDQSGAVLPGVEVAATQNETGITRSAISNETGAFVLPNLPLGPYRFEAALPGFRTFAQTGIVLQVNSSLVINVVLEVGQVAETVEVQANAAMVETQNVGVGQVVENQRILELPLNGRNVTELITLAGSAVQMGGASLGGVPGTVRISVAGGVQYGVSYSLDGAMHNNPFDNANLPFPFPDALQEFKVETSGLSAQNGGHSAGSVNSVTKSGTNEFHGSLFEFVRNDLFNATSYFAAVDPRTGDKVSSSLKRNQFGGTIGGPIIRNKLFFFGGYQGTTVRQDPANIRSFVPTAAMLAGDFTAFASGPCNNNRPVSLRAPFANNRIDPAQFNRAAMTIAARLPKTSNPCGEITFGRRDNSNDFQYVGRIDYQRSEQHSIFGRLMLFDFFRPLAFSFTPDNILNTAQRGEDDLVQTYTIGDTYLLSPNTINALRLTVNRSAIGNFGAEYFSACDVGINIYCGMYSKPYFILSVSGGNGMSVGSGANGTNASYRTTTYQISDDVSVLHGNHQMAFGAIASHHRTNQNSNSRSPGNFTMDGTGTGLGMADFLLGRLSQFQQGGPSQLYIKQTYFGAFATDTWKARPNLTLSGGLRWEPYFPLVDTKGANYNFSYERFRQGIKSKVFLNAPSGLYFNGDDGFPAPAGVNSQWWHFAPRVGLAWDVSGDGRMSVRASYGLAYDFLALKWRTDTTSAPPWGNRLILNNLPGGLTDPWAGVAGGSIFPYKLDANAPFAPAGLYMSTPYDMKNPYVQSWNLSVQRQFGTDWVVSTNYLGNQMTHLWATKALNPAIFFPGVADSSGNCFAQGLTFRTTAGSTCSTTGNTEARRLFSLQRPADGLLYGGVDEFDDGGTRNYHALRLSVERRASDNITVSSNYTWSRCIGDFADTASEGPGAGSGYVNPTNRDFDRGNCDADRRHIFNLTTVAQTPEFANRTLRAIGTGWRLSGIYRKSSGNFLTVTAGTDRALNGIGGQRANQVLADPYGDKSGRPGTSFLNLSAFAVPAPGTFGNVGRYSIEGLGSWAFDTALSRIFEIREGQRLEFRAEAYNVTNSFRPSNPNTAVNNSQFGVIRGSQEPRVMQFALKYVF
jgi:hypothetical protein